MERIINKNSRICEIENQHNTGGSTEPKIVCEKINTIYKPLTNLIKNKTGKNNKNQE